MIRNSSSVLPILYESTDAQRQWPTHGSFPRDLRWNMPVQRRAKELSKAGLP
jgi:hypothetical protein